MSLVASPSLIDVGKQVDFFLRAKFWPSSASVQLSFLSAHHGFSGNMPWRPACTCFELGILLARREHPLEAGHAIARVTVNHHVYIARTGFQIRGLAPGGKAYSPGGRVFLSGWVSDQQPVSGEREHYCGWIKTQDALGVTGYIIKYVLRYQHRKIAWYKRITSSTGIACSQRAVKSIRAGTRVYVDFYSAGQHASTSFVPRT
ncbi:MAG: hypothetical protein ACRDFX_00265 [Chloroflexota bacterium]